jgi:hypothetical protein
MRLFTAFFLAFICHTVSAQTPNASASEDKVITIPVVVHVLYSGSSTISDQQIISQINALNTNFNGENPDIEKVPAVFRKVAGVSNIRFVLAKVDPSGKATSGITRKKSAREMWSNDDKVKDPAFGGVAPWDASSYLNIWVCNMIPGLLGYASAPGSPAAKDGVVIKMSNFGANGSGSFGLGRTAVHEVGHWLNLKHLWGDKECGSDDVDDTPQQRTYNLGVPTFPRIGMGCSATNPHGEMFMNFMDFTNDAAMMMFTQGQVKRMRALFADGGLRRSLLSSKGLGEPYFVSPATAVSNNVVVPAPAKVEAVASAKLFPNPATDRITISAENEQRIAGSTYSIFAADGRVVTSGLVTSNNFTLNISSFHRGIYFVKIGEDAGKQVIRFVKQ